MEGHSYVKTLLQYSQLNVKVPLNNLSSLLKKHLKDGYSHDDIGKYCDYISTLKELIAHDHSQADLSSLYQDILDLLENVCLPYLHYICPTADNRKEVLQLLGCFGRLISVCVNTDVKLLKIVVENIDHNLGVFIKEKPTFADLQHDNVCMDIQTMLEVLRQVLIQAHKSESYEFDDNLKANLSALFDKLVLVIEILPVEIVGSLCMPVLLKVAQINQDELTVYLKQIWQCISNLSVCANERKTYMLLCGFANHFFPITGASTGIDLREDSHLWQIVQTGLVSNDSINRKRSLYILKRVVDICETSQVDVNVRKRVKYPVFWWNQDKCQQLSKVWEAYMLLAEVFEEKQVHVIKPLLPRMKTLLKAAEITDSKEAPLLHTSWLMTLFYRCSFHESLQIIRWASDSVLSLDLHKCPLFEQGQDKYLTGPLLDTLQESRLYIRDPSNPIGSMPPFADKLVKFFSNCWESLPDDRRGEFICRTVQYVCETSWSFLPLMFVLRSLAHIPASPCLDQCTVISIRKLFAGSLRSAESYLRGTIQCYLVQMLTNLTDKTKVQLEDFMQILSLVNREESLQRGTTLWDKNIAWLQEDSGNCLPCWNAENVRDYIEKIVVNYLETSSDAKLNNADITSAAFIARFVLLASDASIATFKDETGSSQLLMVLQKLATVINSINTHAYMPQHKADKALLLLNHVMTETNLKKCSQDDPVTETIRGAVADVQSELLLYVSRQMTQGIQTLMDLPLLDLYLESLTTVLVAMETVNIVELGKVIDACSRVLLTNQQEDLSLSAKLVRFSAMSLLGRLADFLSHDPSNRKYISLLDKYHGFLKSWKLVIHFPRPKGDVSVSQKEWGKVTSLYLQNQWQIVHMVLQNYSTSWCGERELLDVAIETLAVGLEETVYPVIKSAKLLINKVVSAGPVDSSYLVSVIDACWVPVIEARRAALFWNILKAFVQTTFQQCLLVRHEDTEIVECLRKYGAKLIAIGLERNGVANVLADQLWSVWHQPSMVEYIDQYMDVLVHLCMFGNLPKRTDRQLFEVCAAIKALGSACSVNDLKESLSNDDNAVRATAVNILCCLDPTVARHRDLATCVVETCVSRYNEIVKGFQYITFSNSLYHRQRHRLVQVMLLLEQFVTETYMGELWTFVWSSLEQEGQPSVRHMLEWIAIATITKHESLILDIWKLFTKFQETKNLVLLSLLTIVVHVGPHLKSSYQADFLSHAIPAILPWCMAHHFNTRIFAQAGLVKLWEQCQSLGLSSICEKHAVLQTIVDFHQGNRNSTKNVTKLLDSFFFKYLDIKRDFSIETIFHTLPKLTGITEEEYMSLDLFLHSCPMWESSQSSQFIVLYNPCKHTCESDMWRYRGGLKAADDEESEEAAGDGDVQKKIMPWRQMLLDEEALDEIEYGVKQGAGDGLVVVTSLIDKIPNLGGLCRTSEIFGVSEYVLGKLQYVEDKSFQSLSVTAHKWLPITEVYETKLPEYLQQKRLEGYTLVGVEQTANSVSLTDYVFPEKTLLLLGNEKEGIPVDLISLLDVCVEIPQQGVVRSLNVHVSGALLIWEYRRQQLVKNMGSKMA